MRRQRRRTSGLSLGTVMALTLTGLVIAGCVLLLPRLIGNIELRVDSAQVGVAIQSVLKEAVARPAGQTAEAPNATPATAPPIGTATVSPTPTQAPVRTLTLTAAGSISVDTQIQKAATGAEGYAFGPVFAYLLEGFQSQINLATLENLTVVSEKLTDVNMPSDALSAIRQSGVDVLCMGFYGALNSGVQGLSATLDAIRGYGMTPYGVYPTAESRNHVTTLQTPDLTVAFLSFQSELSAAGNKKTTREEQAFVIAPLTLPSIAEQITAARAAGAQVVVVSLCWGKTGASTPTGTQKELAQGIADAGADIILGTHSGVLLPVEMLTGHRANGTLHQTLCAYSLGNLLESDRAERDAISGALLHIRMSYDITADQLAFDSLTYTPTYVWRGKIDGKTSYRVLRSNVEAPDFVDREQQKVMERCLKLVRDALADSPVSEVQ